MLEHDQTAAPQLADERRQGFPLGLDHHRILAPWLPVAAEDDVPQRDRGRRLGIRGGDDPLRRLARPVLDGEMMIGRIGGSGPRGVGQGDLDIENAGQVNGTEQEQREERHDQRELHHTLAVGPPRTPHRWCSSRRRPSRESAVHHRLLVVETRLPSAC
jgi:hypothetical protein